MKTILALDLATVCGYAVRKSSGRVESGSQNFACKKHEAPGVRWARFRAFLVDVKAANPDLELIIFEDVIAVCRQLGFKPVDNNEADALGILHVATGNCPVLTNPVSRKVKRPKAGTPLPTQPF